MTAFCFAQNNGLYPIKKDAKWGVINERGTIILPPLYDAIGSFKHYNYAIVQKDGKAGLINENGDFIFQTNYKDIRIISEYLFGIFDGEIWNIVDKNKRTILKGYDNVETLNSEYIIYWRNNLCGIVDYKGKVLIPSDFDNIYWDSTNEVFIIKKNKKIGLYSKEGIKICSPSYKEINIITPEIILVKKKYKWGMIDEKENIILDEQYSTFKKESFAFLSLYKQEKCYLFSLKNKSFITNIHFNNFIPLSEEWISFQKFDKTGLMDKNGKIVIQPSYKEILNFGDHTFRISVDNKWGIVNSNNEYLSPIIFDYISPVDLSIAIGKKDKKFGIFNSDGKLVANTIFDKIEIKQQEIKAYQGKKISIFKYDEDGLQKEDEFKKFTSISIKKRKKRNDAFAENYQLENYEWFYDPENKKWGLRNIQNGSIKIPPSYDYIKIKRSHQITLASKRNFPSENDYVQENLHPYYFNIIDNESGKIITDEKIIEIRLNDFSQGMPAARIILDNNKHALLKRDGKIICKGYAFIGEFHEGLARMSMRGILSTPKKSDEYSIITYNSPPTNQFLYSNKEESHINLSTTCTNCEWGYIDTIGRLMVPPEYESLRPFKNGVGIAKKNGKWGLINKKAKEVLPFQYDNIEYFDTDGKTLHLEKENKKFGLVNNLGEQVCESKFESIRKENDNLIAFKQDGKWGYMLPNGHTAINPMFTKSTDFNEGIAAVFNGSKWGFINKKGELIIDYNYSRVGLFNDGLAWVKTSKGTGYIDKENKFTIPPIYNRAFDFENGIARVKIKGKIRLINKYGEFISTSQFDDLSSFDKYGLAVARNNSKNNINYFLVNTDGERISSQSFRRIYPFKEGIAAVKKKDKYGFINAQGQILVDPIYDKVSQFSEGLAWVKINGNCGYINKMGKFVVEPEFSKCKDFEDGKAIVYVNARKGGLVDKEGDYVLEPKLNKLLAFTEGKGLVEKNRKFHFVRESGELYEGYYDEAETFEDGIAFVKTDDKWGIINKKGIAIISPKYESIERMGNGINKVSISKTHGIIKPNGQFLLYPTYEYVNYMGNGIIRIERGGEIGYMDINGIWIWRLQG